MRLQTNGSRHATRGGEMEKNIMMKVKVTDKEVREGYYTIELGYCDAQNILNFQPARFYNCGVYELDFNLAICTGYNPIRSIPKKLNDKAVEIIRRYDKKAEAMRYKDYKKYDNYRRALDRLYKKMVEELKAVINYQTVRDA